jgi:hypothetical protein
MQPHHTPPLASRLRDERGLALIIAIMATSLMLALSMALIATTMTETRISGNYSDGTEALYAADAAVERVMQDLLTVPDWNNILNGSLTSSFIDGAATGTRTMADGTKLDLGEATNMVRCGKVTACSSAELDAFTAERPWGPNNPRWQLYAYSPMDEMLPTEDINSRMYVVVWIADDPSETDNNPLKDGEPSADTANYPTNPGRGVLTMLAHAYGPNGVRRVIEVTVARTDSTEIERGYTGQRGQDEQNRRARKAAVQTPGKALTRATMGLAAGGLTN